MNILPLGVVSTGSDGRKRRGRPPGFPVYSENSISWPKSILNKSHLATLKAGILLEWQCQRSILLNDSIIDFSDFVSHFPCFLPNLLATASPIEMVKRKLFIETSPAKTEGRSIATKNFELKLMEMWFFLSPLKDESNTSSDRDVLTVDLCSVSPSSISSNGSNARSLRPRKDINHNGK